MTTNSKTPLLMDKDNNNNNEQQSQPLSQNSESNSKDIKSNDAPAPGKIIIVIIIILGISAAVAFATDTWIIYGIAFGIQLLIFFIHAWPFHSERFYDFTGMITYIAMVITAFLYYKTRIQNIRVIITSICILCWTLRLGFFQLQRLSKGHDPRFANKINNFTFFLVTWMLQGQWCYWTAGVTVGVINNNDNLWDTRKLNAADYVGWILFLFGWSWEVIADYQKTAFKNNPANKGKFCNVGVWKLSRRPNYFGEIILWIGIFVASINAINYKSADWLILLSPLFTILLLLFVSGIPLAEKNSDERYGKTEGYQEYKNKTPILIPGCICWKKWPMK